MKDLMRFFLLIFIFTLLPISAIFSQPVVRIGMVIDGPWQRNDEILQMTENEILTLTEGEFDVRFHEDKILTADWSLSGVNAAIERSLADTEVDIVLAMGVIASGQISRRGDLPKPVIAPFVVDAKLQGLPSKDGTTGVKNLSYLSIPSRLFRDIQAFLEIVRFTKVTILVNEAVEQAIPELYTRVTEALNELNVMPVIIPVGKSVDSTLNVLTSETEAVYVAPLLQLSTDDFDRLVQTLIERKIPSFSLLGVSEVKRGIMATLSPDMFPRITRRIALNLQRILLGEKPENLPIAFTLGQRLTINMATARKVGVSPPFTVMTEAEVINELRTQIDRTVSLGSAMQEALAKNLDLAAEDKFVSAGKQNISEARSLLLPQIDVSGQGVVIDKDRAEASFGAQAERTVSGAVTFSQIIFSEPAWANLAIQGHLQEARIQQRDQLRLDIARESGTAYLDVLRAKTFERLQKENLKRTRENLELAQIRETIGTAKRSEVFRWESEIANDRQAVIEANAQRNLAEIALNRLLHHPLEEPFLTQEIDLNDPNFITGHRELLDYFDDPVSFKTFRAFMVKEGLDASPELRALEAAIAAKNREFTSASRSFWAPTIALQAEISRFFYQGGAGTTGLQLPSGLGITFPKIDDTNWNVGVNFAIPLFEGGSRFAQRTRANEELQQLRTEHNALAERIEQRVRSTLHISGASHAGIALSRDAAEAANKNLDLVADAYSQGAVDILDLLDAQNAALTADLVASNAVYDFLIDLMEVERAIGKFYFFGSEQERAAWFQRLQEYFEKPGVKP